MHKSVQSIYSPPSQHWVGDGFPVRTLFDYNRHGSRISPFLLLDHAGPYAFEPRAKPHGVGAHPHRGFETVTIVFQGEVSHRDS
ncbi:MAG: pirin family protein, partial [Comamonas sp.]